MKLSASVKQWALAFVAVDALALLLLFTNCVLRPADCLETFTFGPLILYLPVVLLLDTVLTDVAALPVWMIVAAIIMLGTASHALLGALVGWALGNRRVPPPVSFLTALAILVLLTLGFATRQLNQEVARKTVTSLWAIESVSEGKISYRTASMVGTESPSMFELVVDEDGPIVRYLEDIDRTEVWLICNDPSCEGEMTNGQVRRSFREYVAAREACADHPTACPYYDIGARDAFEVTYDPNGIIRMVQVYIP